NVTSHCTTRCFDLTSSYTSTRGRLKTKGTKRNQVTCGRHTAVAAFVDFAEFRTFWLQHFRVSLLTAAFALWLGWSWLFNGWHAAQNFTFKYPNLYADDAVSGHSFRSCIIDICTQGVQRHTTFAVPFGTRDFSAAQTTANFHLNAF